MNPTESSHLAAAVDLILEKLGEVYGDPIFATVKIECPECNGTGVVQHWLYDEFYKAWANADQRHPINDALIEFFADHGYGRDEIPPEEEDCYACWGTGEIRKTIELSKLFRELIERVDSNAAPWSTR